MTKLKLTPKKSLGRVLSLDEMKSISGGMNAFISCECILTIKKNKNNGIPRVEYIKADPLGDYYTPYLCQLACYMACDETLDCIDAVGIFNEGSGSGS